MSFAYENTININIAKKGKILLLNDVTVPRILNNEDWYLILNVEKNTSSASNFYYENSAVYDR